MALPELIVTHSEIACKFDDRSSDCDLFLIMPSQSTLSSDDKAKVKAAIPVSSSDNKIFSATLVRIYYAHPKHDKWSYTGLQGALAFVKDHRTNSFHFKLVDIDGTRGVIWEHELYEPFDYFADRAFFHSFPGDVSTLAFCDCSRVHLAIAMYDRLCLLS